MAASLFASDDKVRFALLGVNVRIVSSDEAIVSATNGMALYSQKVPFTSLAWEFTDPFDFTIPIGLIKPASFKTKKSAGGLIDITLGDPRDSGIREISIRPIDGVMTTGETLNSKFPNTCRVIPISVKKAIAPKISFDLYGRIGKAAHILDAYEGFGKGATFYESEHVDSGNGAFVFIPEWQNIDAIIVIMPIKGGGEHAKDITIPSWATNYDYGRLLKAA